MKRAINVLILGFSLLAIEYVLLFFFLQAENIVTHAVPPEKFSRALRGASELTLMRLLFYYILWVILIYIFYGKYRIGSSIATLSVMNCIFYIIISGVY